MMWAIALAVAVDEANYSLVVRPVLLRQSGMRRPEFCRQNLCHSGLPLTNLRIKNTI